MTKRILVLFLTAILIIGIPSQSFSDTSPEVVINRSILDENKLPSSEISLRELIDIFTKRRTRWENGEEIIVVTRNQNSIENDLFLLSVLGLTPYQYKTRLQRNLYRGKTNPPIEVSSEEEMFDVISSNSSAIGYLYNYMIIRKDGKIIIITVTE